jgi:hypothetical protein
VIVKLFFFIEKIKGFEKINDCIILIFLSCANKKKLLQPENGPTALIFTKPVTKHLFSEAFNQ